jgi:hypothetical protein
LSLIWQRWHFLFDKFIFFNLCFVKFILWRHIVPERRVTFNINDKLKNLNESNSTISPDKLKIKAIQGICKLLYRNEVNTIDLFLKVIEELQNILGFRMESMSLLHN